MIPAKILGISASLRNARRGKGQSDLIDSIKSQTSKEALLSFLTGEAAAHLENFEAAGRLEQAPFDEIYKNLKKLTGKKGLSNSEAALASSLWAAHQLGCEIEHLSLAEFFDEKGGVRNLDQLIDQLESADGILISSPVYFGDRSSLSQSFVEELRENKKMNQALDGKVYAGIAVGAKRNGGQETALIYQLWDMLQSGLLGVGNDSETTSQYGGTGHAGDVGIMPSDTYGIDTALGTGRRIARVATMLKNTGEHKLADGLKVSLMVLQDKDDVALNFANELAESLSQTSQVNVLALHQKNIKRCLACDVCPTHIDVDEEYRCIIKASSDDLKELHPQLLDFDLMIPIVYSPTNREKLVSVYQQFIERTRYLRRGDYALSDAVSLPIVIEDLGVTDNMGIRMMTSTLRHHTVLAKPLSLYNFADQGMLNKKEVIAMVEKQLPKIEKLTVGKLLAGSEGVDHLKYNPVGYVLSAVKDIEDQKFGKREEMIEKRTERRTLESRNRLTTSL